MTNKTNHVKAMLDATHTTFGTSAPTDAPKDAKPSTLSGFKSKAPAASKPAKRDTGATAAAFKAMAKGDW